MNIYGGFMKAAVLVEPYTIQVKDVHVPEPGPGEVLIRVTLAGICGSDYSLYTGKLAVSLPVIPGHEAIGRIEKLGSGVSGLAIGQRVTIQPNFSCGECRVCRSGHENICPAKVRLGIDTDGVFAEYVKVPAGYVWPIPEELEDGVAVFTEPLAVPAHALKKTAPRKGDRTLILGAGVIGLLTLQLAVLHGAEVTACDLEENRLALAKRLGASQVIDANDPMESAYNSFDYIYEASGAEAGLSQAIQLAGPSGRIVVLGLPGKEHPVPTALIVRKELQIMGSMVYTDEFPQVLGMLKSGQIETAPLITAKIPLSELNRTLEGFASPDRVKILVTVQ
jgi:2-desacetyl-2-hydroxyethyl bacteriochlorophyllide A dehydrogenase